MTKTYLGIALCILLIGYTNSQVQGTCDPATQIADLPSAGYCIESCNLPKFDTCPSPTVDTQGPWCAYQNKNQYQTIYTDLCNFCRTGGYGYYRGICPNTQCSTNNDCPSSTPVCDTNTRFCRASTCLDPGHPCPYEKYCDTSSGAPVCRAGCLNDANCPPNGARICDTTTNTCRNPNCAD